MRLQAHCHRLLAAAMMRAVHAAAIAVSVALAVFAAGAAAPRPAFATDPAVEDSVPQQAHFLRLGTSKSAVIKLPAAAKDVIVGESAIVDVVLRNRNTAYLFARTPGQTNVFFFDGEGREILHLDLEVTLDSKGLKKLLDRSLPGNRIDVDTTGNNVVLKGSVENAVESKMAEDLAGRFLSTGNGQTSNIVNLLKLAEGDQVMLKVRVVELKRTVLKQLGVDLTGKLGFGPFSIDLSNKPSNFIENSTDTTIGWAAGGNSIDANIQALEGQGLATTLAEPTLTAISGAQASFRAGGEFPYRVLDGTGADAKYTVEFKPYGVSLGFTPTVLSGGRIALNINTEVSELARFIDGVPAIDIRKAQTSVEIPSGGSMMLAGLIKNVSQQELRGAPGLRSLPVLGALFSSRNFQMNQTELVVIVTPYLARPVEERQLATPLDTYNPPTDKQQIFLGRLNRIYGAPGDRPSGAYHGQVGHIIE